MENICRSDLEKLNLFVLRSKARSLSLELSGKGLTGIPFWSQKDKKELISDLLGAYSTLGVKEAPKVPKVEVPKVEVPKVEVPKVEVPVSTTRADFSEPVDTGSHVINKPTKISIVRGCLKNGIEAPKDILVEMQKVYPEVDSTKSISVLKSQAKKSKKGK